MNGPQVKKRQAEASRRYRAKHPERSRASVKKYYQAAGYDKDRVRKLKRRYNLTQEQYDQMLQEQCGRCAICSNESNRLLHVDHNHITGAVRALLCDYCNRGLGQFQDSIQRMELAVKYLKKYEEWPNG